MNRLYSLLLSFVALVGQIHAADQPNAKFDLDSFADFRSRLMVGISPVDSLAANSLVQIRERRKANLEPWKDWYEGPRIISASEWLATVAMRPEEADAWPVFRINHPDLISLLKLPHPDKTQRQDGKHYSWNQLEPGFKEIEDQAKRILEDKKDASQRNAFDHAVLQLRNALTLYLRLKNTVHPQDTTNFATELAEFEAAIPAGVAAARDQQAGRSYNTNALERLLRFASRYDVTQQMQTPLIIPPQPQKTSEDWGRMGEVLLGHIRDEPLPESVSSWAAMSTAFQNGQAADFNSAVARYRQQLTGNPVVAPDLAKASREVLFNRMAPFYNTIPLYVVAFLLACFYWFNFAEWARKTAWWLIMVAFVIHTAGLIFRMSLEGRPPVTNLYSSAIFIGWGAVGFGLILEKFWRNAIGLVVGSTLGFVTLIIAHNLALGGDTLQMLQAVLDTNVWLATHVVIVTLGYASTYVAGFLAIIYILRGVFTRGLDEATGKSLARMVYGIVCFATLFSFIGTVLGGIWADQSWGRFWGWDPKENGALIIVLWNALVLHARWGGLVRERGLMNLVVAGNIVTSWSWFGTNMLGIGLHSYGFMSGAFLWLLGFVASQLLLIALGCLPANQWRSYRARTQGSPKTPTGRKPGRREPVAV